jgi:hypothetical protein
MFPSPITLIGLGNTGNVFGRGNIPIRVIVPHHFFRLKIEQEILIGDFSFYKLEFPFVNHA